MKKEADFKEDEVEARFKDTIFANNPDLYKALFADEVKDEELEDDSFNWVLPQSEAEARSLLAEMQEAMG